MWNLSLGDIHRIKEELKGRRAALRARYDEEVQALEVDLANIETLELAAGLFVAKYQNEPTEDGGFAELVPMSEAAESSPGPNSAPIPTRNWRALLDKRVAAAPAGSGPD